MAALELMKMIFIAVLYLRRGRTARASDRNWHSIGGIAGGTFGGADACGV